MSTRLAVVWLYRAASTVPSEMMGVTFSCTDLVLDIVSTPGRVSIQQKVWSPNDSEMRNEQLK